jgi:hypothetical protein
MPRHKFSFVLVGALIFYSANRNHLNFKIDLKSNEFAIYKKIWKWWSLPIPLSGHGPKPSKHPYNGTAATARGLATSPRRQNRSVVRQCRPMLAASVVDQNPPTGVDRQQESREARSLYPLTPQLAQDLMLRFIGRATWPIPGQEGVWRASASFMYT